MRDGLIKSARRITGSRSVNGKICLSEASYFPISGGDGNSALLVQHFPLAPLAKERGGRGVRELKKKGGERFGKNEIDNKCYPC